MLCYVILYYIILYYIILYYLTSREFQNQTILFSSLQYNIILKLLSVSYMFLAK